MSLNREKAKLIDPTQNAYNVLLDTYEKGMTVERLDTIFTEVREGLVPLIATIKLRGSPPDNSLLKGKVKC